MVKKRGKVVSKKIVKNSGMPIGIKIISIFTYVLSFLLVLLSIFLFSLDAAAAQNLISQVVEDSTASATIANDVSLGITIAGFVFLLFAVLLYWVGRKLSQGKNWARVLLVIFFGLGFVGALADILMGSILNNLPDLIIDGVVVGYLLFNKAVQRAFAK